LRTNKAIRFGVLKRAAAAESRKAAIAGGL
jgi:hypothetical protein